MWKAKRQEVNFSSLTDILFMEHHILRQSGESFPGYDFREVIFQNKQCVKNVQKNEKPLVSSHIFLPLPLKCQPIVLFLSC